MKPNTRIAIAGLLSAAGSLLNAFATEFGAAEAATAPEPEAPKRGRKAAAPAAATEPPADPVVEPPAVVEEPAPAATASTGDTTNAKYEEHRALIGPLVQGPESTAELRLQVKEIVKKYSPHGGLKVMEAKHHASFEKDIAALSY